MVPEIGIGGRAGLGSAEKSGNSEAAETWGKVARRLFAPKTQPNWNGLRLSRESEEERLALRKQTAKHQSQRMKAEGDADCIRVAGGDPDMPKGKARLALIAKGRKMKARMKSAKQAHVKRLHSQRLRSAMPPWADRAAMQAIYAEAQRLTAETGEPHEVDHILPLLGREVSGLHVEYNLRVVHRTVNRRKSNRVPPAPLPAYP